MRPWYLTRVKILFAGLALLIFVSRAWADEFLLDLPAEKQKQTLWCWASVSAMAGHSFDVKVDQNPISQLDIVRFRPLGIKTNVKRLQFSGALTSSNCTETATLCNQVGDVWLYELDGSRVRVNKVLKKQAIIDEIRIRKRPVIVKWDFTQAAPSPTRPKAPHFLMITGFNPDNGGEFLVFDPWTGNEDWISYDGYLFPSIDLGQPVFAMHKFEVFNLRPGAGNMSLANTSDPVLDVEPRMQRISLRRQPFDRLDEGRTALRDAVRSRSFFTNRRVRVTGPVSEGQIYPIVTITTERLMRARKRPEKLLEPSSSSLIASVIDVRSNEVVDSMLVYNDRGKWRTADYSNTTITKYLGRVEAVRPSHGENPREWYYLVSIPEQATFFAARGFGADAMLTPLTGLEPGAPMPARDALTKLVQEIDTLAKVHATSHVVR